MEMDWKSIKLGAYVCREIKQNITFLIPGLKSSGLEHWMAPLPSTENININQETKHKQKYFHLQFIYCIKNETVWVWYYNIQGHFWNILIDFQIE